MNDHEERSPERVAEAGGYVGSFVSHYFPDASEEQRRRLVQEGIDILDQTGVDLTDAAVGQPLSFEQMDEWIEQHHEDPEFAALEQVFEVEPDLKKSPWSCLLLLGSQASGFVHTLDGLVHGHTTEHESDGLTERPEQWSAPSDGAGIVARFQAQLHEQQPLEADSAEDWLLEDLDGSGGSEGRADLHIWPRDHKELDIEERWSFNEDGQYVPGVNIGLPHDAEDHPSTHEYWDDSDHHDYGDYQGYSDYSEYYDYEDSYLDYSDYRDWDDS